MLLNTAFLEYAETLKKKLSVLCFHKMIQKVKYRMQVILKTTANQSR